MFEYKFKDVVEDKKTPKKKELIEKLKGVDETFTFSEKPTKSEDITLERHATIQKSEDDINKEATEALKGYRSEELGKINDDYIEGKSTIDTKTRESMYEADKKIGDIQNKYNAKKDVAVNDSIKKGTSRGSIVEQQVKDIDTAKDANVQSIKNDLENKITSLNSQMELLEIKKQNALDAFDIAYAVKLSEKINKINDDLATYNKKVAEYNNAIAEKEYNLHLKNEAEYQKNVDRIMDRNQKLVEFIAQQGRTGVESRIALVKSQMVLDYLDTMDAEDAVAMLLSDSDLANALGEVALDAVLKELAKELKGE